jgi:molybdopterin molybdotransferase
MTANDHGSPAAHDPCGSPSHGARLLRLDEARSRVLAEVVPVADVETVELRAALGRVLAAAVHSEVDVPAQRSSAMDGYACCARDLPGSGTAALQIVGISWAGRPYAGEVRQGQCVRIMTGAVLPEATDTVVMQEHVRLEGTSAVIEAGHRAGQNVRAVGEDMRRGALAVAAGTLLQPTQLGLLASLGVGHVPVRRRPRVAIFSTGDELRLLGEPLGPGQIYDSNRHVLHGVLTRLGVEVIELGNVADTRDDTLCAFEAAAAQADAIVTSGGVSVGDADHVTDILRGHGQVEFWKVAIKPGKPIAFGRFGGAYFFGLPGNPVSALVTFYQLVQPALRALQGAADADPPILLRASCESRLRKHPGRLEFQRGILSRSPSGVYSVRSAGHQGAATLLSMSDANCFIILPLEQGDVEPGTEVEVQPFAGLC